MINGVDKLRELKCLLQDLDVENDSSIHKVYFLPFEFTPNEEFNVYVSVDNSYNRCNRNYDGFTVEFINDVEEDSFAYSILIYSDFDFEPFDILKLDDVIGAIDKYRCELPHVDKIYFKPEKILQNLKPVLTFETDLSNTIVKTEMFGNVVCKINVLNDLGVLLWKRGEIE